MEPGPGDSIASICSAGSILSIGSAATVHGRSALPTLIGVVAAVGVVLISRA
ncbi:MAG: hypothetical protein ACR2FE_12195 [Aeromicrobium sp.]